MPRFSTIAHLDPARLSGQIPEVKGKKAKREDGYDSDLERDFAQSFELGARPQEPWLPDGWLVNRWTRPAPTLVASTVKIRGRDMRYTADFLVSASRMDCTGAHDHRLFLVEVKGFMRPQDRARLLAAAERYKDFFGFVLVTRPKGEWVTEVLVP